MKHKILIWDNDGTVTGSKNPNDTRNSATVIFHNVKETMQNSDFNFIISGYKSPESELQNFDANKIITRFSKLMSQLPINAAAFSPAIGGIECYVLIKKNNKITVKEAHKDPRYIKYIGKFKKPDIGMFMIIKDIALEEFGQIITQNTAIMIGDTWHDEAAARSFGIDFINASIIHNF